MTEQLPAPEEIAARVAQWRAFAYDTRKHAKETFQLARETATPATWRVALETIRGYQDGLEEALAAAIILHGGCERMVADAKERYDHDWAEESDAGAHTAVRRGPEMEGPRERYAKHDLKVFGQLRAWRQAEQSLSITAEAERELQVRYRAVNATREDIHSIIRALAFEQSLERT
jgi:hypothetical protein